jgi:peptidyl-prolyl cis-trans isomerase B (cyclophilin B)
MRRRQDRKIVLIDFGAVKEINTMMVNTQGQTSVSVAIGTYGYMPSEQAAGQPKLSSDIYAVGMLGISALTGRQPQELPKDTTDGEVIWRNWANVSDKLARVLNKMVSYHFRDRYFSAGEALQALQQSQPQRLQPQPPPQPQRRQPQPQPIPNLSRRQVIKTAGWLAGGFGLAVVGNRLLFPSGSGDITNTTPMTSETVPPVAQTPVSTSPRPSNASTSTAGETETTTSTETTSVSKTINESVPGLKSLPRLEGKATVVMTVNGSPITIEVDGINAPITAGNFVDLVQRGVYDGLAFHRVIRDPEPFVVQGGDPKSKDPNFPVNRLGTGGYVDSKTGMERRIPLEITPQGADSPIYNKTLGGARPELQHRIGAVAMARSQMPDSASSQFYFTLANLAFLDGSYAVFGYVTDGFDVVNQIQQGDRIKSAKVTQGAENLKTPE